LCETEHMNKRFLAYAVIGVLVAAFYNQYLEDEEISMCLRDITHHRLIIQGSPYEAEPIDDVVQRCVEIGATQQQITRALTTPYIR
jgi:hypothetical protein